MRKIVMMFLFGLLLWGTADSGYASEASQLSVQQGRNLLFNNGMPTVSGFIAANNMFQSAVQIDSTDQQARFFYAITRVLTSLAQKGSGTGLGTIRDLLESFGFTKKSDDSLATAGYNPPAELFGSFNPPTSIPSGAALQAYLAGPFVDLLNAALADLSIITNTPTFSIILTSAETGDLPVDIDYGDVLLLRSMLYTTKAYILIMNAWDMDIDLRQVIVLGNAHVLQLQRDLLDKYQNLLHLKTTGATGMSNAKAALINAIDSFGSAFTFITAETDDQSDDLFAFADQSDLDNAQKILQSLNEAKASLLANRPAIFGTKKTWVLTIDEDQMMTTTLEINLDIYGHLSNGNLDNGWYRVTAYSVTGSSMSVTLVDTYQWGDCNGTVQLNGTLGSNQITNGTYTFADDCNGPSSGTFSGSLVTEPDLNKVDLNKFFGNTGKTPLDIRAAIPALNANNKIIAESPIVTTFLGGLFPDIATKAALFKLFGDDVIHTVPVKTITVDGNKNDWTGISSVATDDDHGLLPLAEIDLQSLYVARDTNYLYWMVDFRAAPTTNLSSFSTSFESPLLYVESTLYRDDNGGVNYSIGAYDEQWNWLEIPSNADDGKLDEVLESRMPIDLFSGVSEVTIDIYSNIESPSSYSYDEMSPSATISLPTVTLTGTVTCSHYNHVGNTFINAYDDAGHRLGTAIVQGVGNYSMPGLPIGANVHLVAHWDADDNGIVTYGDYVGSAGPITIQATGTTLPVTLDQMVDYNFFIQTPSSLSVPSNSPDGSITVSWGASATLGVSYTLQQATDPGFDTGLVTVYTGSERNITLSGRNIGETYYYRVMATKNGYADSIWLVGNNGCIVGTPAGTQAEAPTSIIVPSSDPDGSYSVSWGASATAGVTYVLEEATDSAFTTGKRQAYTGTDLSANISGRVSGMTYYYRVMAKKTGYTDSAWKIGANGCIVADTTTTTTTVVPTTTTLPLPYAGTPASITVPSTDPDGSYTVSWGASATPEATYVLEEAADSAFTTGKRQVYTGTAKSAKITGRTPGSTYYYRVSAKKSGYTDSAWKTGANGCIVTDTTTTTTTVVPTTTTTTTVAPATTTTFSSTTTTTLPPPLSANTPATITVPKTDPDGSYSVSWGASTTAGATYVLEEATDSAFTTSTQVYSGTAKSATITGRITGSTYYYRVKAKKSGYTDSTWRTGANGCSVQMAPTATPASIIVPSTDPDGSYSVSWGASTTAGATYVLEEATDSGFTTSTQVYSGTAKSATITGRTTGSTYYYRVKAKKSGYTDSAWKTGANGCSVQMTPAATPASIIVPSTDPDGSYSVSWGASTTAGATYVLEEATDSAFTTSTQVYTGTAKSAKISGRTTGSTYYYRVKAKKTGFIDSAWKTGANGCSVQMAPAATPASITVPSTDTDGSYSVNWGTSATAGATYVLEEATDSAFTTSTQVYAGTAKSAKITGRTTGSTYYYRVKAKKTGFIDSAWKTGANGCSVQMAPAATPASITVPSTDTDGSYSVNWGTSATAGATYVLEEATDSAFTTSTQVYAGTAKSAKITGRTTGSTYYYRVKAKKSGYTDSAWKTGANGCSVQMTPAVTPASIIVPSTDPDGSYSVSWGASATAGATYVLEEATDSAFTTSTQVYTGTTKSAKISGRATGSTYYYRVKAQKVGYTDSAWKTGTNGCLVPYSGHVVQ